jgi:hypothetical protein
MQSFLKPLAVGASVAAIAASFLTGPATASTTSPALPTLVLSVQDRNTLLVPDTRTLGCDDPEQVSGSHPRRAPARDGAPNVPLVASDAANGTLGAKKRA